MSLYSNGAGTKEWLAATKDIQIRAYIEGEQKQETAAVPREEEPLFGAHLKEAVDVIRGLRRG